MAFIAIEQHSKPSLLIANIEFIKCIEHNTIVVMDWNWSHKVSINFYPINFLIVL